MRSNHIGKLLHHPTSGDQPQGEGKGQKKEEAERRGKKRERRPNNQTNKKMGGSNPRQTKQQETPRGGNQGNKEHLPEVCLCDMPGGA